MKVSLLSIVILLSSYAYAFDFQAEREKAQERFGNAYTDYPILIVDHDKLDFLFAKEKAHGEENKTKRLEIIKKYVQDEIGVEITNIQADSLEPYLTVLKESAFAFPVLKTGNNKQYEFCAVLPASANSNHRLEIERLIGLLTENVYEGKSYEHINSLLNYEKLSLFSLYHELAHCLDPKYLPVSLFNHDDPHGIHESESFAETLALFMLHQMGHKDLSKDRGIIRTLYAKKMGAWFHQNPGRGFGSETFIHGGTIYHLQPVLQAAEDFILKNRGTINSFSIDDLIQSTISLVENNSLDSRSFHAISISLKDTIPDQTLNLYRERAYNYPDLFYQAYERLVVYQDYTSYVLKRNILDIPRNLKTGDALSTIDYGHLCSLIKNDQYEEYSQYLTSLRINLQNADENQALQLREQAQNLNQLSQKMFESCL